MKVHLDVGLVVGVHLRKVAVEDDLPGDEEEVGRPPGAGRATSISLAFETVLLFWIVRRRLGLHVLAFGKAAASTSS